MALTRETVRQMAAVLMDAIATEERMADRLTVLGREAATMGVEAFSVSLLSAAQSHRVASIEYRARLVACLEQHGDCYAAEASSARTA